MDGYRRHLPRYDGFSGDSPLLRHGPVSEGLPQG